MGEGGNSNQGLERVGSYLQHNYIKVTFISTYSSESVIQVGVTWNGICKSHSNNFLTAVRFIYNAGCASNFKC